MEGGGEVVLGVLDVELVWRHVVMCLNPHLNSISRFSECRRAMGELELPLSDLQSLQDGGLALCSGLSLGAESTSNHGAVSGPMQPWNRQRWWNCIQGYL